MNIFALKSIKVFYIYHSWINIFYNNKRSKLCFGDRVVVLINVMFCGMDGD
jgi:hypothetical protein